MKNFTSLSAIGFCLTFIFILNIGIIIATVITGDHLLAAYAIGLSGYQFYLHHKFAPIKKGFRSVDLKPFDNAKNVSIKSPLK